MSSLLSFVGYFWVIFKVLSFLIHGGNRKWKQEMKEGSKQIWNGEENFQKNDLGWWLLDFQVNMPREDHIHWKLLVWEMKYEKLPSLYGNWDLKWAHSLGKLISPNQVTILEWVKWENFRLGTKQGRPFNLPCAVCFCLKQYFITILRTCM